MSHIADAELFEHSERARGKIVLVTGAASGIGKETALKFASYGAKVVSSDINMSGAEKTAEQIRSSGGDAIAFKVDITVWNEVVDMYELTIKHYGAVDIVVASAGVTQIGDFSKVEFDEKGRPKPPELITLNIDLIGSMYTAHLAQHYLLVNKKPDALKSLILLGSIASWLGIPDGVVYCAAKSAVLAVMRSLHPLFEQQGMRIAAIHPFYVDTGPMFPLSAKLLLAGVPVTPVSRVAGAIVYAATHPDAATSGCAYMLPDNGPVFKLPRDEFKLGVYKVIDERSNALFKSLRGIQFAQQVVVDLVRALKTPLLTCITAAGVAWLAWNYEKVLHLVGDH
ncbi:NAD(P)-binding protein [Dendrothele bispora CBS 962.96]|uniref:NAD(P)-binding protein n=1 Tax=Dendrothele bispora (strain CBS 962.96) TaxID=1314807 RepID=A0A4S8LAX0_DENBC|nr:NAD(P)-binding protein [Dendrothele bispora CBS 962.96]